MEIPKHTEAFRKDLEFKRFRQIPINTEEHNAMIMEEIKELLTRYISHNPETN